MGFAVQGDGRMGWLWKLLAVLAMLAGLSRMATHRQERAEPMAKRTAASVPRWVAATALAPAATPRLLAAVETASVGYSLDVYRVYATPPSWSYGCCEAYPTYVAAEAADITGDGRGDVVTVVSEMPPPASLRVFVMPQLADGSLGAAVHHMLPEGYAQYGAFVGTAKGDLNNDGAPDLVVTRQFALNLVLSDGHGGLIGKEHPATTMTVDVAAVTLDIDLDGNLDIVAHTSKGYGQTPSDPQSRLVMFFGDGRGGIAGQSSIVTGVVDPHDLQLAKAMVTGDFNWDGLPDLAILFREFDYWAQFYRSPIKVFLNDGAGSFLPPYTAAENPLLTQLAAGDFNKDGRVDLAAVDNSTMPLETRVWVYKQSSNGRVEGPPMTYPSYTSGGALDVADLDRDGASDLVVAFDGQLKLGYYLQKNGALGLPVYRDMNAHPSSRFGPSSQGIGDINGDGCNDLAVAATFGGLWILRGSGCNAPPLAGPCQMAEPYRE